MRACPFCGSGEMRTIEVQDSWTEDKKYRVVCEICDAMGTPADDPRQAERFWDGVLAKSDSAFKRFIGESINDNMDKAWYRMYRRDKKLNQKVKSLRPGDRFIITGSVKADWVNTPLVFKNFSKFMDIIKAEDPDTGELFKIGITQPSDENFDIELLENEGGMGGVSSPMSTLTNTPGMGNAQPAKMAAMTGAQQTSSDAKGSGDRWDSSIGKMHTQATNESLNEFDYSVLEKFEEFRTDVYNLFVDKGIPVEKVVEMFNDEEFADDLFTHFEEKYSPEEYVDMLLNKWSGVPKYRMDESKWHVVDAMTGEVIAKNLEKADAIKKGKEKDNWAAKPMNEMNLNPYDKIGMMMAKKLGVEPPFKQGDSRTNTVVQRGWEELDEDQEKDPESIDDYVKDPDKVFRNAKKRKVGKTNESYFRIETLDSYLKASKHVPDHLLTLVKKEMIKEEDLRTEEVTKDVKAKEALEKLGIAFEFKPAKSGKNRTFIKEPIPKVLDTLKEGGWEEYGKNPENTIRKYIKDDQILTIYAEGKELPRATLTPKSQEEAKESFVIRKVVPNSINPYIKS